MNTSEHSTTQGELEKLVSDLRGLLGNKPSDPCDVILMKLGQHLFK